MARIRHIANLVIVATLAACASDVAVESPPSLDGPQWPARPNPARISYLHSVATPADAEIRRSWFGRAWRYIKGADAEVIGRPQGIHVDPAGRLYVVDAEFANIHVFDTRAKRYFSFPGQRPAGFEHPVDVVADAEGRVFVSDSATNRVHVFDDFGRRYLTSFGAGELRRPTGLALRAHGGELLVVDTLDSSVVIFDTADFSVRMRAGRDGKRADAMHYPTNIAIAPDGDTYVTDSLNFRIQRLDTDMRFAGHFGRAGDSPGFFSRPKGVAVDSDGHIYVVDALFDNVQVFSRSGELLLVFGTSGQDPGEFWLPSDIQIDAADRIYVADSYNSRVQVFQYHGQAAQ